MVRKILIGTGITGALLTGFGIGVSRKNKSETDPRQIEASVLSADAVEVHKLYAEKLSEVKELTTKLKAYQQLKEQKGKNVEVKV